MNRRKFLSYSARSWMMAGIVPSILAENEMGEHNQHRRLSFSNDWIESSLFAAVREMPVADGIVVNLSPAALNYRVGADHGTILPWKSSTLRNCMIELPQVH